MTQLSNAKIIGGIGALLMLVGWIIPTAGFAIVLVGLVLLFVGVKYITDETKDNTIFRNYMYYFICMIIAIVAVCVILLAAFASVGGIAFFTSIQSMDMTNPMAIFDYLAPFLVSCAVALLIGWIIIIIGVFFLKKSYDRIAEHTKVGLFKTTGLVYLIGAFTLIILIGAIILLIAKIMEVIAFFTLPETLPAKETTPPSTIQPPPPSASP